MKLLIFALIVVADHALAETTLMDDMLDILGVLPVEQLVERATWYRDNVPDFQELKKIMNGEEGAKLMGIVRSHPWWKQVSGWMLDNGVDVNKLLGNVCDWINGGCPDCEDELVSLVPSAFEKLWNVVRDKTETSPKFAELFGMVKGDKALELFNEIVGQNETNVVVEKLNKLGVPAQLVVDYLPLFMGGE